MNKKIAGIVLCVMFFVSFTGIVCPINIATELTAGETFEDYSHNILGEFGTRSGCKYCGMANAALKNIYAAGWHPFYYVTLVCAKNAHAKQRAVDELVIQAYPTVFFDGGYRQDIGTTNISNAMNRYNTSIIKCGNRNVADIDLSVDVEWLGAVNRIPENGATNVYIEPTLVWNLTAMNIDVTIDNNESTQYDGHLHVYVTEVDSQYWFDYYHLPYTMAFLDYAWNEDVEISAGGSWEDSMEWDGCDYDNGMEDEDLVVFDDIFQDNTMVIASIFNSDTNYSDETAGTLAGVDTYPKTHDVYFGNTSPPPQASWNQSSLTFSPGSLPWNTTYYWKVVTWDNQDNKVDTPIFSFTTRDNHAPNIPSNPVPLNNSNNVPININMSWTGGDPDGDLVYYDVYFGSFFPPIKVVSNQTETYYEPGILGFNTTFYWKIVAWDRFGLTASGPDWIFKTQENLPPNEPSSPIPPDGANDVPVQANLSWVGGDPNQGDVVKYDVYLEKGDETPDKLVSEQQIEEVFDPDGDFELFATYYWQIVAWDSQELSTTSQVWRFTTGINNPPGKPSIDGEVKGKIDELYDYTFSAEDPEGDNISYFVDWGDGTDSGWQGPFPSGYELKLSHNWTEKGDYIIKSRARDKYLNGEWSQLRIKMPKNKPFIFNFPLLEWLFDRFPDMFLILRYIVGLV